MRPHLLRTLVLDLFVRVQEDGELADKALHRTLRAHPELHSRERRHVAEALFALVRNARRLDFQIDAALTALKLPRLDQTATPDANRLRYAAAISTELGVPIDEAVSLAGTERRYRPLLERLTAAEPSWPADPVARLALERSIPDWFAERIYSEYGINADPLAAALNARAPLTLRTNALKATREEVATALVGERIRTRPGTLSPWALVIDGHANVFGLKAYKSGLFEVQDEGSQLIAMAADARPGQLVVDACAGGGGKTLALAASMKNKGRIIACDVTEARLADVPDRTRRAGVFLVDRLVAPEADDTPLARFEGKADVVLVDAPCSGTGSWRRHADARWKLTAAEADAFPAIQRAIVERYARLVKRGGRLVYATCSILGAENDAVADAFAAAHPDFEPRPIELPAPVLDERGRLRVLPHVHGTDGFFAAAFRRKV